MNVRALLPALAVVLAVVPGSPAAAAGPADGGGCAGAWRIDHPAEGRELAVFAADPVVIADGTDLRTGRVTCSIQYGVRHSDPDAVAVTSLTTPGAVALPPVAADYVRGEWWQTPQMCTEVEIDGAGTFYWDTESSAWSPDPDAPCYLRDGDPFDVVFDLVDGVDAFVQALYVDDVDPVVCPLLADAAPGAGPVVVEPEGDVYVAESLLWDCPPYV